MEGRLTFLPGEAEKEVTVKILDNLRLEEDENFDITLSNAQCPVPVRVSIPTARVTIVDDDHGYSLV
jgi:hypothetical protein